jgi:prophage regulatory protein
MNLRIIRKAQAAALAGISKTNLWEQTKRGTFPPAISLGARAVGFLQHEVEAVIAARATGQTEAEIQEVVKTLVERRKATANNLISRCAA